MALDRFAHDLARQQMLEGMGINTAYIDGLIEKATTAYNAGHGEVTSFSYELAEGMDAKSAGFTHDEIEEIIAEALQNRPEILTNRVNRSSRIEGYEIEIRLKLR